MSPRRKLIYKWSSIGTLGFVGFLFDNAWIRNTLFVFGGLLLAVGWVLGMQIAAERTLSKRTDIDPSKSDLG